MSLLFAKHPGQKDSVMEPDDFPFITETHGIEVAVASFFLRDQSLPEAHRYVWAYRIRITNHGNAQVQLLTRHWIITDGSGRVEHVRGPGVVGEQPVLNPGEAFEYTSGCPLATPTGMMVGTYEMTDQNGGQFDIDIPAFSLDSPFADRTLN
jgi:ApaG protein